MQGLSHREEEVVGEGAEEEMELQDFAPNIPGGGPPESLGEIPRRTQNAWKRHTQTLGMAWEGQFPEA